MTGELATESHHLKKYFFFKHKPFVWPTVHKWFAGKRDRHEILTHCKITSLKNTIQSPKPTVSQQTSPADMAGGPQSSSGSKCFPFCFLEQRMSLASKRAQDQYQREHN